MPGKWIGLHGRSPWMNSSGRSGKRETTIRRQLERFRNEHVRSAQEFGSLARCSEMTSNGTQVPIKRDWSKISEFCHDRRARSSGYLR